MTKKSGENHLFSLREKDTDTENARADQKTRHFVSASHVLQILGSVHVQTFQFADEMFVRFGEVGKLFCHVHFRHLVARHFAAFSLVFRRTETFMRTARREPASAGHVM